ncbi:MAG: DUF4126 domain-containing protein [Ignavibacterium sp.]|jgi:hypothetical protein|nr:DUF4126 domain-containing protein [Ignavibacterium sp.]
MEIILGVFAGIGLAAAAGFRIFIPFLITSIAAQTGVIELSTNFSWIGSLPALIAFSFATVIELIAYYIPWLDNLLDTIEHPLAIFAGIILTGSVITDFSPFLKWIFAIIAGGSVAGTIQAATGFARFKSSALTGGTGNPVVSSVEAGSSIGLSLMAVFVPVVAILIVILIIGWAVTLFYKKFIKKSDAENNLME